MDVPRSDWFKKPVEALARSQKDCDTAELWRAEPGKRNSDAVNHAVVEFVMDARSASLLPVLHPSSQVYCERYYWGREGSSRKDDEEQSDGWEDIAMVRAFKEEGGEDQTCCEDENKKRETPTPLVLPLSAQSSNCYYPAAENPEAGPCSALIPLWFSHNLWEFAACKTKEGEEVMWADCHPKQGDADGGRDVEGKETGREQIEFPPGNTTVAERKTEKNGEGGRKAGLAASSKYW